MLKNNTAYFLLVAFLLFISTIQASELPTRLLANAYTGVYTVGQADLMVSIEGDRQHNLYVNPQGAYGSDQLGYADMGLGYRWIKNDAAILGWYVFAGHTHSENSSGFWITNPGLEVMGSRWDARVNAYIPVAGRSDDLGKFEFDRPGPSFFTGHSELRNVSFSQFNEVQQIGNGADARVGYQLFPSVPLKAYVGAYFFDIPHTEKVRGGAAGMEYWFDDHIRVFADYSYDNYQQSNIVGGLGISFGGVRNGHWADPSLSERLTDPVERYLANLGHGSRIPSQKLLYGAGSGSRIEILHNNIAFFSQTGTPNNGGGSLTLANCTFENPCGPTDFSQTGVNRLNTLLPNTRMYFNGGNYFALASPGINPLTLNNGQSVSSRTTNYSAPATSVARSIFGGGFILSGNNRLENIILIPFLGGFPDTGVRLQSGDNEIQGSSIGTSNNRYEFAIDDFGNNTLINGTTIFSNSIGVTTAGSNLTLQNSTLDLANVDETLDGIFAVGGSVSIIDSTILVTGSSSTSVVGLRTSSNAEATVVNSEITVSNDDEGFAIALENNSGSVNVIESNLNVEGTNTEITTGNPVNIGFGTVCSVNGAVVTCP